MKQYGRLFSTRFSHPGVQLRAQSLQEPSSFYKKKDTFGRFTLPGDSDQVTDIVEDSGKELGIKDLGKGTNVCCASTVEPGPVLFTHTLLFNFHKNCMW